MNKTQSLGWGVLASVGGILVALLLYFLYLKKKKVKVPYFIGGFFLITAVMFVVVGSFMMFGLLQQGYSMMLTG